jgi:hypothetical protein
MIQIGRYGYWFSDVWFYEATSTWLEDVLYTDVNDYYNYMRSSYSHFYHPDLELTYSDAASALGIVMYSRCILGVFLTKRFGANAMRTTWERIRTEPPLPALRDVLPVSYSSTFVDAFGLWTAWNSYTNSRSDASKYYPEGSAFPIITETPVDLGSMTTRTISSTLGSPGARYFRCFSGSDTVFVGFAYGGTASDAGSSGIAFSFTVSKTRVDASYRKTGSGLYLSYSLPNASEWTIWEFGSSTPSNPQSSLTATPYPNPFIPQRQSVVNFPTTEVSAVVSVYTLDMVKVYEAAQQSEFSLGRRVFTWNGMTTDGKMAGSGVYFYVLSAGNSREIGKFTVVRE